MRVEAGNYGRIRQIITGAIACAFLSTGLVSLIGQDDQGSLSESPKAENEENQVPAPERQSESSEGAEALWVSLVTRIESNYFETDGNGSPVYWTEAEITSKVSEILATRARQKGRSIEKLSNLEELTDVREIRSEFFKFIELLRIRDAYAYELSRYVEAGIEMFCREHLKYSQYWPQQFSRLKGKYDDSPDAQARPDFRIRQIDGAMLCFPYPEGEAWKHGLRDGDRLITFDGEHVEHMAISEFASRFLGVPNSKIQVGVRQKTGRILSVPLTRSANSLGVVPVEGPYSKIYRLHEIGRNTAVQLRELLEEDENPGVVLDLRGNGGGPLDDVADLAGLFITGERPLLVGQIFEGSDNLVRELKTEVLPLEKIEWVTVIVDKYTASTAELFVKALQDADPKGRVCISGEKTYGKDVWLDARILESGGRLVIPVGQMKTAQGNGWPRGISPDLSR